MMRAFVDAAAWTGRTGEWRGVRDRRSAVAFWCERGHGKGQMLPAYGFALGLDMESLTTGLRLFWRYRRVWLFRRVLWGWAA